MKPMGDGLDRRGAESAEDEAKKWPNLKDYPSANPKPNTSSTSAPAS
jgi:hypothetical protein